MKILMFLIFVCSFGVFAVDCILPSPDNISNAREPDVVGKILYIGSKSFSVAIPNKGVIKVNLPVQKIAMFSQYGGIVLKHELKVGYEVRIWTKNCKRIDDQKLISADKILVEVAEEENLQKSMVKNSFHCPLSPKVECLKCCAIVTMSGIKCENGSVYQEMGSLKKFVDVTPEIKEVICRKQGSLLLSMTPEECAKVCEEKNE